MVNKFFNWLVRSDSQPIVAEEKPSLEELRRIHYDLIHKIDENLRESERKFTTENPDKYKLVITTDDNVFESEEYKSHATHHTRTREAHHRRGERERLEHVITFGVYEYAIPHFTTADKIAEEAATRILMPGSVYHDKKSGIMVSSKDIKSVRIVKIDLLKT